jgi:hypothetical protein
MSMSDCGTCCQTDNSEGEMTFINALGACACTDDACPSCADTWCMGDSATGACETCLENSLDSGGSCYTPVTTACGADMSCVDYIECVNACPTM